MISSLSKWKRESVIVIVVVLLDQITKYLISSTFTFGEVLEIIPGVFNLTLAHNKGAAFGMFAGFSDGIREVVLFATTIIALGVIVYFIRSQTETSRLTKISFMLVISGAIGNIIDRVRLGYVIDFLDFYISSYHWPAFNVADSAICIGVAGLVLLPSNKVAE